MYPVGGRFVDRQKSYADLMRKPIEFKVGDRVMLKVSPWKGVVRFSKRCKLNPRYVEPFKVLAKVGKVSYRLELPQELSRVHHTFHVSNLKKCYTHKPLVMSLEGIHVDDKLQFVEEPVKIMEREIKRLKQNRIPLVKVNKMSTSSPCLLHHLLLPTLPSTPTPELGGYIGDLTGASDGDFPRVLVYGYDDSLSPSTRISIESDPEEIQAQADFAVVVLTIELVSPPEATEPVTPPPFTDITTTGARITVRLQLPYPFHQRQRPLLMRYCRAIPSPSTTNHYHHPIHTTTCLDRGIDIPESERHLQEVVFVCPSPSTLDAKERRRGIREFWYGIRDTWVDPAEEDAQDSRTRISQRVTMDSQRVDCILEDRKLIKGDIQIVYVHESQLHAHQIQLQLQGTLIQTQHQVYETRSQMQQAEMAELRETDRRRQAQIVETLRVMRDMRREMGDMQAELLALREQQRRARQPGPDVRVPDHQDASRDADSHIYSLCHLTLARQVVQAC
ncbi:hypothetical protein Tco_0598477 [Tanacetum coccineum]